MKKLVLIAVWASIITTFLTLNYLLWERENPDASGDSTNLAKNTIKELETAIKRLEDSNIELQKEIESLNYYNNYYQEEIRKKNLLIYEFKKMSDLDFLKDIVELWVECVDDQNYKKAFRLFSNTMIYQRDTQLRMRDYFSTYESLIKTIKLESIELDLEHTEKGRNGEIIFKTVLEVKHLNPQKRKEYAEGLNTRYFFMVYDDITEEWYIGGIEEEL